MLLVTKFDKLEAYLEERLYFEDEELQKLVTSLGLEVDEAEQDYNDMVRRLDDWPPPTHGGFFV